MQDFERGVSRQLVKPRPKPHPLVSAKKSRHFSHASKLIATQSVSESFVDELNEAM